jgi:heparosan-N-sulfate-glucuronate 5-epimerase
MIADYSRVTTEISQEFKTGTMISKLKAREKYLRRIFASYVFRNASQLTFWHETPRVNPHANYKELGPYYMTFEQKALYPGPFDHDGIPLLNYHGDVGLQYYSIAVSQYALGNYNLFKENGDAVYREKFLVNARWLIDNLVVTPRGTYLWPHHFDFEYFQPLKAPWFSGLAQGQGLSVLVRAFIETEDSKFRTAAESVFRSLTLTTPEGGVLYKDDEGNQWIEEYLVDPPTHILNGFIWALWGIYDYHLLTGDPEASSLFKSLLGTITRHLGRYDAGFWSFYELTPQRIKSLASPFYHRLHIVQLEIMHLMTDDEIFLFYANKWREYLYRRLFRVMALIYKTAFKLVYY